MKKFYVEYIQKEKCFKDEIIIYAKDKKEAQMLGEKYILKIECDYFLEPTRMLKFSSPKEDFDEDDAYIIRKTGITEPKMQPIYTPIGDLLHNILDPDKDSELAYLNKKDIKEIRKNIKNIIKSKLKEAKKRH